MTRASRNYQAVDLEAAGSSPLGGGTTLNVLSLFAGAGGLELGLERAGMTVVGQVERDPYCMSVLTKHWPEVPKHDDVTTAVDWWGRTVRPRVDLVCGGFPCQPFSHGGFQRGVDDERWLWPAFERVLRAVRPSYVVVENVSALTRDAVAFGWVLGDLHKLGFDAEWTLLRASDVGAPHPRERVFLVAYRPSEHGIARHLLGQSGDGRSPLSAGGLPSMAVPDRGQLAREWLAREPRVDRLADGIPAQVDRLRLAGNAVVPQLAEHIGRVIVRAHTGSMEAAA
jgi:DNA (cytosine-5)-methyltransferase 1